MRTTKQFLKDLTNKPPQLFPLVGLFFIFTLCYSVWNVHSAPFPSLEWLQPAWMLAYLVSWLFLCDMRRWAAWLFTGLVLLNLALYLSLTSFDLREIMISAIFPLDILFGFFVLFYYKRYI